MSMRFENKVVVVTGAAQGIGEAYAKALGAEGAVGRRGRPQRRVRRAGGQGDRGRRRPRALRAAPTSRRAESAAALVEATVAAYGGIDGLVNNAAIYGDDGSSTC